MMRAAVIAMAMLSGACAAASPLRAGAGAQALELPAGRWSGTYVVDAGNGREGTLAFALQGRGGVAAGEAALDGRPLTVRMMTASDGFIYGDLDAYLDEARKADATMTLRGELRNGEMRGSFRTTFADGSEQTLGHWSVTREKTAE